MNCLSRRAFDCDAHWENTKWLGFQIVEVKMDGTIEVYGRMASSSTRIANRVDDATVVPEDVQGM
jgi:hypothetical protein